MPRHSSMPSPEKLGISKVCIFGASGMLGRYLASTLAAEGVEVTLYRRSGSKVAGHGSPYRIAQWDPAGTTFDTAPLEAADAVINLCGESLADGRWTRARKERLWSSRVNSTELIAGAMAGLSRRPRVLINASAVGFYGDRGLEQVTEESPRGQGFLAELCEAWEGATRAAADAGVRVVLVRFGVILAADGGALAKLVPLFRAGLGGRLGSGMQHMPWISIVDAVGVVRFCLARKDVSGPVNAVSPDIITNAQLTEHLGRTLGRTARLPVPAFALKLILGELAQETLLGSARVTPKRLEVVGYRFEYPRLEDALHAVMRPEGPTPSIHPPAASDHTSS